MPGDGVEREFKAMLEDAAERDRILSVIGGSIRVLAQRNLIFDTPTGALAAARLSLRLRNEDTHWLLTAKGETQTDPASLLTSRGEAERPVHAALALHLAAGTAAPLPLLREAAPAPMAHALADAIEAAACGAPLGIVGEFRNERTLCPVIIAGGLPITVALDCSEMPDGSVEHELELEVPHSALAPAAAFLDDLMRRAGVPLRPALSKRQRFARALARRDAARRSA